MSEQVRESVHVFGCVRDREGEREGFSVFGFVRERERKRKREREREGQKGKERSLLVFVIMCVDRCV